MNGEIREESLTSYHVTLRDYIRILFRQKSVILICVIVVSAAVYVGLKFRTPVYQASTKMLISAKKQVEAPYYTDTAVRDSEAILTQSEIVRSAPVLERAVKALQLYERPVDYERAYASPLKRVYIDWQFKKYKERMADFGNDQVQAVAYLSAMQTLKNSIRVEPIKGSNLFSISAIDYSPYGAAVLANVVSRSYVIFDLEQQLAEVGLKYTEKHQAVAQLKECIVQMEQTLHGKPLSNVESIGPATVKIIEQATIPLRPAGFSKKTAMSLGFGLSILLGITLAFIFEWLDQSFRSKQDLENFLKLPVLACVNKKKKRKERLVVQDPADPKNRTSRMQSYRILSEQIHFLIKNKHLKTILVTSVAGSQASAVISANLGVFLSKQLGHRVLLVDANLRNPALHKFFNIPKQDGLCEMIEGKIAPAQAIHEAGQNLDVMPPGQSALDPGILLDPASLKEILKNISSQYTAVIVDSADLREQKDAVSLSGLVDGVLLVVNESGVRKQVVRSAVQPLHEKKANLIGVVMNNRDYVIPKIVYDRI